MKSIQRWGKYTSTLLVASVGPDLSSGVNPSSCICPTSHVPSEQFCSVSGPDACRASTRSICRPYLVKLCFRRQGDSRTIAMLQASTWHEKGLGLRRPIILEQIESIQRSQPLNLLRQKLRDCIRFAIYKRYRNSDTSPERRLYFS